jgi:hypothetical protein
MGTQHLVKMSQYLVRTEDIPPDALVRPESLIEIEALSGGCVNPAPTATVFCGDQKRFGPDGA